MKKLILVIIISSMSSNCLAYGFSQSWAKSEIQKECLYLVVSWFEMELAKNNADKRFQQNSLLLRNDSTKKEIEKYFIQTRIYQLLITDLLEHHHREIFQNISISLSIGTIGIGFSKKF